MIIIIKTGNRMKFLLKVLKDFPWFLWSGWGAIASLLLFIAIWDVGHLVYGDLILPSPKETLGVFWSLFEDVSMREQMTLTLQRALTGFGIALILGSILGLLAGFFVTASMMSRPWVTVFVGIPPIAWVVLAMLWFGMGSNSVIFTVVVASFPLVFLGAMQGSRTIEGDLKEMVDSFQLNLWQKCVHLYFPHIFSYIFPAWVSALGMSWKIAVMAELLSASDGLGAELAVARAQLDTSLALALVAVLVGSLLFIEYIILEPLKREAEAWRN